MNVALMVLEGLILVAFKLSQDGELRGTAGKVVDMLFDGLHLAHTALRIATGNVDDSQQVFDDARARFRAKYQAGE